MADLYANWQPIFNDTPNRLPILRAFLKNVEEYPDEVLATNEAYAKHMRTRFSHRNFWNSYALNEFPHHCIAGPDYVLPYDPEAVNG